MIESADLGLMLPLHGVRLVEASAGTGKTFVLATLYARAVIERGLTVDALVAVTFTEAATKELRTRIRERLGLALQLASGAPVDPHEPKQVSTQAMVAAALAAGEAPAALHSRLRQAAEAMDLAPVFTIHGFCRRALAEHSLEAGLAPRDVELVANERALREEVATDLWRDVCADADAAHALTRLFKSPGALADGLRELWMVEALRPEAAADDAETGRALRAALCAAAAEVSRQHRLLGMATIAELRSLMERKAISGTSHGARSVDPAWNALDAWALDDCEGDPPDLKRLPLFGTFKLGDSINKPFRGKVVPLANGLTDAIDEWHGLHERLAIFDTDREVALVHRLRDEGRARLAALKRRRGLQGFDDLVRDLADALAGPNGDLLAQRLGEQYRFAFVDEFQDTDPRQWEIFRRVFAQAPDDGGPRALFLIGDPKQAIYRFRGGDVHTYLEARETAQEPKSLYHNFRSRPCALQALQALYADAGAEAFGQADIEFVPVDAGGRVEDDAMTYAGARAPALEFLTWDDVGGTAMPSADAARDRAATACVARIRELLDDDGHRLGSRPVAPGDIAVLVSSHREGRLLQRRLARAGVPCVAAGRDSLYASDEAADLLTVLHACLQLDDDSRLRAALATPLLGQPASAIAALDVEGGAHRGWQDRALGWRQRWDRHGPLALVTDLCAAAAPRLLALHDGERRLANWMQLGEALQADTAGRTPEATAAHLAERIAHADSHNDEELLRLESDAARVKVLTLHASKGLEFPLVFLPFASHAGGSSGARGIALARHHQPGHGRVGHLQGADEAAWKAACAAEKAEAAAEKLRLLYVGLTRARLATFVGFGPVKDVGKSALATLLFAGQRDAPAKPDAAALRARLAAIAANSREAIVVRDAATTLPAGRPALPTPAPLPPARVAQRRLSRDWGMHSFSALAREAGGADARRAGDETESTLAPSRFSGARFGNVLHEALETVDFAAWRGWAAAEPPPGQAGTLARALRNGGYGSAADLSEGGTLLSTLVRDTLNVALPEGVCLADLPATQRQPELEFHFALAPAQVTELLAELHAHGFVAARTGFGQRARLEGLLTGFIDLVYEHDGRVYLLDYKSNQLPGYSPAALAEAIAHSEYDLQYLLYTLALHRWLGVRRPGYDYDAHFGGVRYLFCRGLGFGAGAGVHATRPPRALVEALDRLLRRAEPEVA